MAQEHFDQVTAAKLGDWNDLLALDNEGELSAHTFRFYVRLQRRAPKNGEWLTTVGEVAKELKTSYPSALEHLHTLARLNLIRYIATPGKRQIQIWIWKKTAPQPMNPPLQVAPQPMNPPLQVAGSSPYSPNSDSSPTKDLNTKDNTTDLTYDTKSESPTSLVGDQSVGDPKPLLGGDISPAATPTPQPTPSLKSAPLPTDKDEAWRKIEVQLGKPPTLKAELFDLWEQIKRYNDPLKIDSNAIKEALDEADWPFAWFAKSKFAPDAQGVPRLVKSAVKPPTPIYHQPAVFEPEPPEETEEQRARKSEFFKQLQRKLGGDTNANEATTVQYGNGATPTRNDSPAPSGGLSRRPLTFGLDAVLQGIPSADLRRRIEVSQRRETN